MSLKIDPWTGNPLPSREFLDALFKFSAELAEARPMDDREVLTMCLGAHILTIRANEPRSAASIAKERDEAHAVCPECSISVPLKSYVGHLHDHAVLRGAKP